MASKIEIMDRISKGTNTYRHIIDKLVEIKSDSERIHYLNYIMEITTHCKEMIRTKQYDRISKRLN